MDQLKGAIKGLGVIALLIAVGWWSIHQVASEARDRRGGGATETASTHPTDTPAANTTVPLVPVARLSPTIIRQIEADLAYSYGDGPSGPARASVNCSEALAEPFTLLCHVRIPTLAMQGPILRLEVDELGEIMNTEVIGTVDEEPPWLEPDVEIPLPHEVLGLDADQD